MSKPSVAILGASTDRSKFGNKAVRAFVQQGFDVYPVNPKETEIEGLRTYPRLSDVPARPLNRVSVYLPPHVGITLLDEIAQSGADEVWFNPGTTSDELLARAEELELNVIQACSIVAVEMSPHHLSDE